jgi:excisionase family DNA binding protein
MSTVPNFFELLFQRFDELEAKLDKMNAAQVPEATKRVLGLDEAAQHTGFSKHTLYRLTSEKGIPHSKRGRKVFFDRQELDIWLLQYKQK